MMKRLPFLRKSKLIFLFSIITSGIYAQGNIGFESGTTAGWTCGSGSFGTRVKDCHYDHPIKINYNGNCFNQGGVNGALTPSDVKMNRHTIVKGTGKDPNSLATVPCVAPGFMFPNGVNTYSFRLGNAVGNNNLFDSLALAEAIKFKINVDSSNTGLTYMYALLKKVLWGIG